MSNRDEMIYGESAMKNTVDLYQNTEDLMSLYRHTTNFIYAICKFKFSNIFFSRLL